MNNNNERTVYAPGLYSDLTNQQYHNSTATGSTQLKRLLEQTPRMIQYTEAHYEPKSNPVYDLGSAVHCLVLEPQNFERDFAVREVWDLRTNAGKAAKIAFEHASRGKIGIDEIAHEQALGMANSILEHRTAQRLLSGCIAEQSVFVNYEQYDQASELLKVRPDAVAPGHPLIVDIKTTDDASWSEVQRTILKYRYHLSAAMYLDVANRSKPLKDAVGIEQFTGFALIVVEKRPPYQVACYELSPEFLGLGHAEFLMALGRLSEARKENWPSYPDRLRIMELPRWADRQHVL